LVLCHALVGTAVPMLRKRSNSTSPPHRKRFTITIEANSEFE
jgi:hypothetical protein